MKYYKEMPDMECLAGDTLPVFTITPSNGNISGCSMEMIIAPYRSPENIMIRKQCEIQSRSFTVQLTSADTERLPEDWYMIHFKMTDTQGFAHRKLAGRLYVRKTAKGGS